MDYDPKQREVYELADALVRGDITPDQSQRLGRLIADDADARVEYLRFMHDSAKLCRWSVMWSTSGDDGEARGCGGKNGGTEVWPAAESAAAGPALTNSAPGSPAFAGLLAGLVFPYAAAGLILALGLVAAWVWSHAAGPRQLAEDLVRPPVRADAHHGLPVVGRITAISNCQGLDAQMAPRDSDLVVEGRSYVLTGGLAEISYDVGATVIIEGPVIYTASKVNGGKLLLGKVTVHARKRDRAAGARRRSPRAPRKAMASGRAAWRRPPAPPPSAL